MATIDGKFVWFDYVTNDSKAQDKAKAFYGELFHWKTQDTPMGPGKPYAMIAAGDARIGGFVPTSDAPPLPPHWVSHLQVSDAAATVAKIRSLGGRVLQEPSKMGDFGTMAVVADPAGAWFALWQPAKPEGTGDFQGKENTWCWNELTTPDPEAAVKFYRAIAGFTEEKMEMGGAAAYHILNSDGKGRAGITKPMMQGVPTMWLPYVQVGSADQTAERVKKLGGSVHVGPADIPGVGRFAIFGDPNGAAFGILQPSM